MSEPQAGPATALLARKGFAAPVGAACDAAQAPDSTLVSDPAPAPARARDLESLPEVDALAQARAAPPASLLPHDFLPGPQGMRDLVQLPPNRPEVAVVPASVPAGNPEAKGAGETAVPPKLEAKPAPTGDAGPETKLAPTGIAISERSGKPDVPQPRPDPALRLALRTEAGVKPTARADPQRFPVLAAGLALALVLGTAGYGYRSGWFETQSPERPQATADAAVAPDQTQPEQVQPEPAQAEATDTALAPAGEPAGTPAGTSAGTSAESPPAAPSVSESDPGAEADQSTGADQSSGAVQPSIDIVRIEPDGAAVIAGRAAPGVELIVLDNGAPIGTVAADAYGEWVFIPASPLPSGAHDFGLVIKQIRGGASVPAAGQAPAKQDAAPDGAAPDAVTLGVPGVNRPGTVAGVAATVPIPSRKPDIGTKHAAGVPSPAFVVQLASVKSRAGAQREWRALRKRFPNILSRLSLGLDEAKLAGGDTVVRLRIGAFPKQAEAAALCARLVAKNQDCLVVRTAVKR